MNISGTVTSTGFVKSGGTSSQFLKADGSVDATAYATNANFTAHTASSVHMTTTEKTNLDSLATNIATISGISSTDVTNWNTAYTNNHTHSNKTYLDGITGNVGTMAYKTATDYEKNLNVISFQANQHILLLRFSQLS